MSTVIDPLAGKPAPTASLIDVPRLLAAYFELHPDPAVPAQRVVFGTSGHRGSSFARSFNEWHVLAISQAICEYRKQQGIDGPLYLGIDTHALSQPAFESALEVLAANGVETMIAAGSEYTPTPAISHAILGYNHGRTSGFADGIVVTPSHNPPDNGGFKYNPPNGGPADTQATGWIETRSNILLEGGVRDVRRMPFARAHRAATTHEHDFIEHLRRRSWQRHRLRCDPRCRRPHGRRSAWRRRRALLGAYRCALQARSDRGQHGSRSNLPLHDAGLGRQDPHGSIVALCDAAPDRPEGSLRHRVRLRYRSRPSRHRDAQQRLAAAESLPGGGDRLPVSQSPALEQGRSGRQDAWSAPR